MSTLEQRLTEVTATKNTDAIVAKYINGLSRLQDLAVGLNGDVSEANRLLEQPHNFDAEELAEMQDVLALSSAIVAAITRIAQKNIPRPQIIAQLKTVGVP